MPVSHGTKNIKLFIFDLDYTLDVELMPDILNVYEILECWQHHELMYFLVTVSTTGTRKR